MQALNKVFKIEVSRDRLRAAITLRNITAEDLAEIKLSKELFLTYLQKQNIKYGLRYEAIETIVAQFPNADFPILIAEGDRSIDGNPGDIKHYFDTTTEVDRTGEESEDFDFRNVMRIPTVEKGEKLARIIAPTKGKDGRDVYGNKIAAKAGRPALLRAGKNVTLNEETQTFHADVQGQVSLGNRRINVHDVYEVNESISMKIGNIDFPGTVIVRGDVPTGFTIKAAGDVKIFGLVEAATIIAEGSVSVSEGIAGLKTGSIEAGKDVQIGYINQGIIRAGNNILVENSMMHSECTAENNIICNRGNIVGGFVSAGGAIKANNVGNRMNTQTSLSFGMDYKLFERQRELESKLAKLIENKGKLRTLKQTYEQQNRNEMDSKMRVTMLRLQYSLEKTMEQVESIKEELATLNASLGNVDRAYLKVLDKIYPNVIVSFGKYERTIDREYMNVTIVTDKNEILIKS
ncbi:MAG TPA: FapA family protein [Pseudogracilibacillus sp.]|nr:FapA family protein [Pseudogracilibacillus sp.]